MQNPGPTNGHKKSNGHNGDWYDDIINHDMDLDDHQPQRNDWDRMDTEESPEHQMEYQRLLQDTLAYGQDLHAEFKDDPRRETAKALEDAFALIAYQDPLNAKEVSHLLDPSGREAVAEELNSVILRKFFASQIIKHVLIICSLPRQIIFSGFGATYPAIHSPSRRSSGRRWTRSLCEY